LPNCDSKIQLLFKNEKSFDKMQEKMRKMKVFRNNNSRGA